MRSGEALGRIHPAFMGGEYLPDLSQDEVKIARITIASTTQDVTSVYARRGKNRIHYRVVDEYGGRDAVGTEHAHLHPAAHAGRAGDFLQRRLVDLRRARDELRR